MIETLIDGFIWMMTNTIFGNSLIFAFVFLFIIIILLFLSKCSMEQILIFLLIPVYCFDGNILTGIAGKSILGVLILFNSYVLFKNIQKLLQGA